MNPLSANRGLLLLCWVSPVLPVDNHTYLKVYKCWRILPILKMPTIKMFGYIFQKKFQFPRILYHLYNNLVIFRVKIFYPINIGRNKASKNAKW